MMKGKRTLHKENLVKIKRKDLLEMNSNQAEMYINETLYKNGYRPNRHTLNVTKEKEYMVYSWLEPVAPNMEIKIDKDTVCEIVKHHLENYNNIKGIKEVVFDILDGVVIQVGENK